MTFSSNHLSEWLEHLEVAHIKPIDLGLDRVLTVKNRLIANHVLTLNYPIITVGGTNGKGSTCAFLEQILLAAGYKVGCHTSPHIIEFTERARSFCRFLSRLRPLVSNPLWYHFLILSSLYWRF